jgi:phage-related baseplate assembly protein
MNSTFTAVDLSRLPFPDVVEPLDFETIRAAMLADFSARNPEYSALLRSDPACKLLEEFAYRELLLRNRINAAAKAITLAHAEGADLDHLAARYNVARLVLDPGDASARPPVPPTFEPDVDLRRRVQLAFEGLSTAGPTGAYIFHALGAHPDVRDASVESPAPGEVLVTVLARSGTGAPAPEVLSAVDAALNAEDVRPLCDQVSVQAASIVPYEVAAVLTLYPGPDAAVVVAEATSRVDAYIEGSRRLGRDVTRSGLFAALHVEGVQNVALAHPSADVMVTAAQASYCTQRAVLVGGTDE